MGGYCVLVGSMMPSAITSRPPIVTGRMRFRRGLQGTFRQCGIRMHRPREPDLIRRIRSWAASSCRMDRCLETPARLAAVGYHRTLSSGDRRFYWRIRI
jgi:hypothetical protein